MQLNTNVSANENNICYVAHRGYTKIVDTMNGNDWLSKMKEIYHSWICKYLDNDKKPIYWQPRSYIRECYLQQKIL